MTTTNEILTPLMRERLNRSVESKPESTIEQPESSSGRNQNLFNTITNLSSWIPLESDMREIVNAVEKDRLPDDTKTMDQSAFWANQHLFNTITNISSWIPIESDLQEIVKAVEKDSRQG
ncbi:MAG TPA: hypothetical protein PK841_03135 [Chitinophagaceae bacterium]|nr:hypothetical protein [Chitinophagaceae bacterium]HNA14756.1 hypothetical protein [Cyclobacteriaceae bacterium]HNC13948.1 hypothetical protein [Cyclobacteriaceae bacterium]